MYNSQYTMQFSSSVITEYEKKVRFLVQPRPYDPDLGQCVPPFSQPCHIIS